MHVLMLSWEYPPNVIGGLARHVYDLSTTLTDQGTEVTVVTMDPGDGTPSREKVQGVDVHRVKSYPLAAPSFLVSCMQMNMVMLEKCMSLFSEHSFDIIHAHDWLVAFIGRALKHTFKMPLLSTIHATEFGRNGGLHNDEQRFISDVEWWLTFESWRVICCSDFMFAELQRLFQLPQDKLRVIFNGVHPEVFQADEASPEVRARFATEKEKIVFYIGRLVNEKGVQVLLDAVPSILARHPQTKFVIAGEGPNKANLEEQARSMGIAHKVHFAGFVDDFVRNQLYKNASTAVFPSLYEPFGIVALEGMAAGTPVVVADTGGLSEIVTHDVTGLKCYPGSSSSLADQVSRLLSDETLARKLCRESHSLVMGSYAWKEIARQTTEVYREVLEEYESSNWKSPRWHPEISQIHGLSHQLSKNRKM